MKTIIKCEECGATLKTVEIDFDKAPLPPNWAEQIIRVKPHKCKGA